MKLFGLLLFITCYVTGFCQPKLTKLSKNTIPKAVKYSGEIVQAVRWKDSTGDNIVHKIHRRVLAHIKEQAERN